MVLGWVFLKWGLVLFWTKFFNVIIFTLTVYRSNFTAEILLCLNIDLFFPPIEFYRRKLFKVTKVSSWSDGITKWKKASGFKLPNIFPNMLK